MQATGKCGILAPTVLQSQTSSEAFMKQLTVIAISTLVHYKSNFPKDNNFKEETFGGIKVWMLKRHCENRIAQFVTDSLINAFEAIDKKYLHRLVLYFYEQDTEKTLEYYVFEFNYTNPAISVGANNKETVETELSEITFEDVEKCTKSMICSCNMMAHGFPSLPKHYSIGIRLFYNNVAPEGYNPKGFTYNLLEEWDIFSAGDEKTDIGEVRTPFHKLHLSSYTRLGVDFASCEANPSDNLPFLRSEEFGAAPSCPPATLVSCPCNLTLHTDHNNGLHLLCAYCNKYQHAICFGVLPQHVDKVSVHCCNQCHLDDSSRTATDLLVVNQHLEGIPDVYLRRHTLYMCSELHSVDVMALANYLGGREGQAWKLLHFLLDNDILQHQNKLRISTPLKINKEELNKWLQKYFSCPTDDDEMTERLIDESVASSSIRYETDQAGNLLEPIRHRCLVRPPNHRLQEDPHYTDPEIEHFRRAILNDNDTEEL